MRCLNLDKLVITLALSIIGFAACNYVETDQGSTRPEVKKLKGIEFQRVSNDRYKQDYDLWISLANDTIFILDEMSFINCNMVWPIGHRSKIGIEVILNNDYCGMDISNISFMSSTLRQIDTLKNGEIIWDFYQEIGSSHTRHVDSRFLKYSNTDGIIEVSPSSEDWPY